MYVFPYPYRQKTAHYGKMKLSYENIGDSQNDQERNHRPEDLHRECQQERQDQRQKGRLRLREAEAEVNL